MTRPALAAQHQPAKSAIGEDASSARRQPSRGGGLGEPAHSGVPVGDHHLLATTNR
jgi:hypothetical protein